MTGMVRVAIVGSGMIAKNRHIPNILDSKYASLAGVCNRNQMHSAADAARFGCRAYADLEEVLRDDAVDAVIVCTPTDTHCGISLRALRAGKHVLCEKPMSVTVEEAKLMADASRRGEKKFMISHNQRFYQPHKKCRELFRDGAIGRLMNFRSFLGVNLPMPAEDSFNDNAASEVLSHRVDLIHYLTGARVRGVFARLARWSPGGYRHALIADDTAMSVMEYDNGVMGVFVASRVSFNCNDRMTQFFGTKGSMTLYSHKAHIFMEMSGGESIAYELADVPEQKMTERTEIDDEFFKCILQDTPPQVLPEDVAETMSVIDAVYRSNKTGEWTVPRDICAE
jgi:predicted dehydrogenase